MVLKPEVIERRLEELDWTLQRLARHRDVTIDHYESDPDLQWIVERGLLNTRNLLVHEYLELDPSEVLGHLRRAFRVFPRFAREILAWMEGLEEEVR